MNQYFYNLGLFFSEVASLYAQKPALRYQDDIYTYQDLLQWIESLASLLLTQNLTQGDVIAIGNNKQPLSYALMLACNRLGIPYVNIDVASPLARNLEIIEVSGAKLLFYDDVRYKENMQELAIQQGCSAIELNFAILPKVFDADRTLQQQCMLQVDGATIAYIMFTSGSTGKPKGVAVTHQNVIHLIAWGQQYFKITEQDNFANLSPMYFDNSVFDFYVGLFSGASLSPIYRELMTNPYELSATVGQRECTVWFSVPSLLIYLMSMKALTANALPKLRQIIFGGEGYPKVELKKLFDLFTKQAVLTNVYGPTECTCICSAYDLTLDDFIEMNGLPPLGKLNPNFDYCILDENEQYVDEGELCLIGPNVASGYFNDIARSELAFFTLTESQRYLKRMYRTGDLVRETEDILYFIGRKDNQVKHMGYRIELEEIEHALVKLPQINQAAVIYQRIHTAYGKLIAFVASEADLDEKILQSNLKNLLPDYMIPHSIKVTNELPKNANGKVDRQQLKATLLQDASLLI